MSEIYDNLSEVVAERQAFTADTILNLRTKQTFTAEVETNLDPFTLPAELGDDPREKVRLHVTTDPKLNRGDLVQIIFGGVPTQFKVVSGYYSATGITSKFLCIQQVAGKDQT